MSYWKDKDTKAKEALKHTEYVKEKYKDEISFSIKHSVVYIGKTGQKKATENITHDADTQKIETLMSVEIINKDSVSALFENTSNEDKVGVLNFASYKNPGGMFLNGSSAQEESLCHESFLYNVLSKFPDYYAYNNEHKNKALYMDRGLYSPDIIFERNGHQRYADVITVAAPNKRAAQRYGKVSDEENYRALYSRINFVLKIADSQKIDTLILGAFGCGVFGQKPEEVANIFKMLLKKNRYSFNRVIFALPGGNGKFNRNCDIFQTIFKQ